MNIDRTASALRAIILSLCLLPLCLAITGPSYYLLNRIQKANDLPDGAVTHNYLYRAGFSYFPPQDTSQPGFFPIRITVFAVSQPLSVSISPVPDGGPVRASVQATVQPGVSTPILLAPTNIAYKMNIDISSPNGQHTPYTIRVNEESNPPYCSFIEGNPPTPIEWVNGASYNVTVRWVNFVGHNYNKFDIHALCDDGSTTPIVTSFVPPPTGASSYTFSPSNYPALSGLCRLRVRSTDVPLFNPSNSTAFVAANPSVIQGLQTELTVGTATPLTLKGRIDSNFVLDLISSADGSLIQRIFSGLSLSSTSFTSLSFVPSLQLNNSAPISAKLKLWAPLALVGTNFTSTAFTIKPWSPATTGHQLFDIANAFNFTESLSASTILLYSSVSIGAKLTLQTSGLTSSSHYFTFCLSWADPLCRSGSQAAFGSSNETETVSISNPDTTASTHLLFLVLSVPTVGTAEFGMTVTPIQNVSFVYRPYYHEVWTSDSPLVIEWATSGYSASEPVNITLVGSNSQLSTLLQSTTNTGSLTLDPSILSSIWINEPYYRVVVTLADHPSVFARSEEFSIVAGATLITPSGGSIIAGRRIDTSFRAAFPFNATSVTLQFIADSDPLRTAFDIGTGAVVSGSGYSVFATIVGGYYPLYSQAAPQTGRIRIRYFIPYDNVTPRFQWINATCTLTSPDPVALGYPAATLPVDITQPFTASTVLNYSLLLTSYRTATITLTGTKQAGCLMKFSRVDIDANSTTLDSGNPSFGTSELLPYYTDLNHNAFDQTYLIQVTLNAALYSSDSCRLTIANGPRRAYGVSTPKMIKIGDTVNATWSVPLLTGTVTAKLWFDYEFVRAVLISTISTNAPDVGYLVFTMPTNIDPAPYYLEICNNDPNALFRCGVTRFDVYWDKFAIVTPKKNANFPLAIFPAETFQTAVFTAEYNQLSQYLQYGRLSISSASAGLSLMVAAEYFYYFFRGLSETDFYLFADEIPRCDDYRFMYFNGTNSVFSDPVSLGLDTVQTTTLNFQTPFSFSRAAGSLQSNWMLITPSLSLGLAGFQILLTMSVNAPSSAAFLEGDVHFKAFSRLGIVSPTHPDNSATTESVEISLRNNGVARTATATLPLRVLPNSRVMTVSILQQATYLDLFTGSLQWEITNPPVALESTVRVAVDLSLSDLLSQFTTEDGVFTQLKSEIAALLSVPNELIVKGASPFAFTNGTKTVLNIKLLSSTALSVAAASQLSSALNSSDILANLTSSAKPTLPTSTYPLLSRASVTGSSSEQPIQQCPDGSYRVQCPTDQSSSDDNVKIIAPVVAVGGAALIAASAVLWLKWRRKERTEGALTSSSSSDTNQGIDLVTK